MSHLDTVISPPGTPLADRTVGELVAVRPSRARVFQRLGIDFCCQGGRTVAEACNLRGIPVERLAADLEAADAQPDGSAPNPAELPPAELAEHIVRVHHQFLRDELPRLREMARKVARVHGGHTPSLVEVSDIFQALEAELSQHLLKEEQVLFPAVEALAQGWQGGMSLDGPLACMLHEHEDAGTALARIRELTGGFNPPPEACNTYRALFAGLAELEEDLHRHIHLENAVLFPAARKMAEAAAACAA